MGSTSSKQSLDRIPFRISSQVHRILAHRLTARRRAVELSLRLGMQFRRHEHVMKVVSSGDDSAYEAIDCEDLLTAEFTDDCKVPKSMHTIPLSERPERDSIQGLGAYLDGNKANGDKQVQDWLNLNLFSEPRRPRRSVQQPPIELFSILRDASTISSPVGRLQQTFSYRHALYQALLDNADLFPGPYSVLAPLPKKDSVREAVLDEYIEMYRAGQERGIELELNFTGSGCTFYSIGNTLQTVEDSVDRIRRSAEYVRQQSPGSRMMVYNSGALGPVFSLETLPDHIRAILKKGGPGFDPFTDAEIEAYLNLGPEHYQEMSFTHFEPLYTEGLVDRLSIASPGKKPGPALQARYLKKTQVKKVHINKHDHQDPHLSAKAEAVTQFGDIFTASHFGVGTLGGNRVATSGNPLKSSSGADANVQSWTGIIARVVVDDGWGPDTLHEFETTAAMQMAAHGATDPMLGHITLSVVHEGVAMATAAIESA